jgi:hypothetical protein
LTANTGGDLNTFTSGPAGKPVALELATTNQMIKLNKKAPHTAAICAATQQMSGVWTVTDSTGQIYAEQ